MIKAVVLLLAVALFAADCAKHNRKNKDNNHDDNPGGDEAVEQWPHPDTVTNFAIPDIFTNGSFSFNSSTPESDTEASSLTEKHHAKANKRRAH